MHIPKGNTHPDAPPPFKVQGSLWKRGPNECETEAVGDRAMLSSGQNKAAAHMNSGFATVCENPAQGHMRPNHSIESRVRHTVTPITRTLLAFVIFWEKDSFI